MDDNSTENAQNSEVNSATMHDVPLSSEEQDEQIQQPIGKSGSLKRFFKLTSKKSNSETETKKSSEADAGAEADTESEENNGNKPESTENGEHDLLKSSNQNLKRQRSRRFNFRFGNNNATDGDTPTSSNNVPSKHSLRSSLSTYFNSVFKRRQGASSKDTLRTSKKRDDSDDENGIEMQESKPAVQDPNAIKHSEGELTEEVHNLNVAEEENKDMKEPNILSQAQS